jgi:hypothetical protein
MYEPGHYESACRDYARHVARVNAQDWTKWVGPPQPSARARLGAFLIVLGTRIAPAGNPGERLSAPQGSPSLTKA